MLAFVRGKRCRNVLSDICETHSPSVDADEMNNDRTFVAPTDEFDLGYTAGLGDSFF